VVCGVVWPLIDPFDLQRTKRSLYAEFFQYPPMLVGEQRDNASIQDWVLFIRRLPVIGLAGILRRKINL